MMKRPNYDNVCVPMCVEAGGQPWVLLSRSPPLKQDISLAWEVATH